MDSGSSGTRFRAPRESVHVFVVDDSELTLQAIAAALRMAGAKVTTRNSAVGARAAMLRERPDVVLLDVDLPLVSGPEIAVSMRAHPRLRYTTILLCSAKEQVELERLASESQADGYIRKGDPDGIARDVLALAPRPGGFGRAHTS